MALSAGDSLLNGQYRIVCLLGRGGFGAVYRAEQVHLGEAVAIKELVPGRVGDEAAFRRFLAEAKATLRLSDDHIVRTHHLFPEGDNYYLVMECMAGGALEALLQEHGRLPVEATVRMAADVCLGLAYAHRHGVVHCDLKPANILFTANPFETRALAKVADFGIAHVSEAILPRSWMTPPGFVAGTLPYMSPEQMEGVRDDPRVDLYALGAVLYRALTARTYLDFDKRDTPAAIAENVQQIRSTEPKPPSAHCPDVPAWLDQVVLKALAKSPEERYAGAPAFRAALLSPEPARVPEPKPTPPQKTAQTEPQPTPPEAEAGPVPSAAGGPTPAQQAPESAVELAPAAAPARPARSWGWLWRLLRTVGTVLLVILACVVATNIRDVMEKWDLAQPEATHTPLPTGTPLDQLGQAPKPTAALGGLPTEAPLPTELPHRTEARPATSSVRLAPTTQPPGQPSLALYPAPLLGSPTADQELKGHILFTWTWEGPPLAADQFFDLRVWSQSEEQAGVEPRGAVELQRETQVRVSVGMVPAVQEHGAGAYYWTVVVVERGPSPVVVGAWGEKRRFYYAGP